MLAGRILMTAGVALFSVGVVVGVVVNPPGEPAAFWVRAAVVVIGAMTGIGLFFLGMLRYLRYKDQRRRAEPGAEPDRGGTTPAS
jgi:hypothetical protein